MVAEGRDALGSCPPGRWRIDADSVLAGAESDGEAFCPDRTWTDRGGYVRGFEDHFDADGFAMAHKEIAAFDPLIHWVLHAAREALRDARHQGDGSRVGAVFGNLSFPSAAMSRYAESVWRGKPSGHPHSRFVSGLPAVVLERALGLGAGAFAIDAACASSLYSIKIACDWLHDGRADTVLAGAVNCADDLFIHVGFSALSALSRSGRSRPFHREADGLVPAEGAAFVTLRRLEDAMRDGSSILGVIRGVGLSNDGRGQGALVPSREGQVRALQSAYELSGISPREVSLLECHATGTAIGDATEIESLREVFGELPVPVGIGSLKANLGHLITAAGVAGLIKVLEAMRAQVRPPTLHTGDPINALADAPFRLLEKAEPWEVPGHVTDGRRRAGISAFGFGGNNAHLIVEEWDDRASGADTFSRVRSDDGVPVPEVPVAIVGIGVVAAGCADRAAFTEALLSGESCLTTDDDGNLRGHIEAFDVDIAASGTPPSDLRQTLPQQLLVAAAAREAAAEVASLPRERTGVLVGMGTDPEVARYGARWRLGDSVPATAKDDVVGVLRSAGVIGTMPNMVANRINRLLDLGGPSCTFSAEERSGLVALEHAARSLRRGELDVAIVGAVDLSCEVVHETAARHCLPLAEQVSGDAAVVVVLQRLADAERDGSRVYATIGDPAATSEHQDSAPGVDVMRWGAGAGAVSLEDRWGHAHAASSLLHLAAAALTLHHRNLPTGGPWLPGGARSALGEVASMVPGGEPSCWRLHEHTVSQPRPERATPRLHVFEGGDAAEVLEALDAGCESKPWGGGRGPQPAARLVLVAADEATLARRADRARSHINDGAPAGEGVHFRLAPVRGELGFVFTSAGAAYHGMGRSLLAALPELGDRVAGRFGGFADAMSWVVDPSVSASNEQRLWGAASLSQVHAELSLGLLGLEPTAVVGYSSGESSSLFALGAWGDLDEMQRDIEASGLYSTELAGRFDAVARAWGSGDGVRWAAWSVLAPVERVREWLAAEDRVHLSIVHTASDCVIAGEEAQCRRVVDAVTAALGSGRCHELRYNVASHVPELEAFREEWLAIHRRSVAPVPGVRFYSAGREGAYVPDTEACAAAIWSQACGTLDFPRVVESAWADGVRVFVEHGPGNACSSWITDVLGERAREAVVVALDRGAGGVEAIFEAVAALIAAGVQVDPSALLQRLVPAAERASGFGLQPTGPKMRLPAHPDPVHMPRGDADSQVQWMEPAPPLAPMSTAVGASVPSAAAVASPSAAAPAPTASIDAWQQHVRHLSEAHTEFVEQQARVGQRFLQLSENLERTAAVMAGDAVPTLVPAAEPNADTRVAGLQLDRAQLEVHAGGRISDIFGSKFRQQDGYARQVRMPEPPLLLADRVTGIDAEAGSQGLGTVWDRNRCARRLLVPASAAACLRAC